MTNADIIKTVQAELLRRGVDTMNNDGDHDAIDLTAHEFIEAGDQSAENVKLLEALRALL